ncbi:MAG: DUF3667 domain-containing protein [Cytophagales bacterium]|nr:DUF3667 domain-containing protein [Cytophagales bacterium]
MTCKNCQSSFEGNFCPECGQSATVKRFSFGYFAIESVYSSLDLERGQGMGILLLLQRPGSSIRNYIQGKRMRLFAPAKFLLLVGAIVTILVLRHNPFLVIEEDNMEMQSKIKELFPIISAWYFRYFDGFWHFANEFVTLTNIISIPVFSLFSFILFSYTKFNYTENLIMNMYIICMQLLAVVPFLGILEVPFLMPYKDVILAFYTLLTVCYNIWVYVTLFKEANFSGLFLATTATICGYIGNVVLVHILFFLLTQAGMSPI